MSEARLLLAEWLLEAGAGASARAVLGRLRGGRANRLRLRGGRTRLAPGVYALLAELGEGDAGGGATIPLLPEPGRSRATASDLRAACDLASSLARARLGLETSPDFRFPFDEWLEASGPSIGLPAFRAFLAHLVPDRAPPGPVLATGRLDPEGRVHPVGHLPAKLSAARREAPRALLLVPDQDESRSFAGLAADVRAVRTVDEAVSLVFGDDPLQADPSLARVDLLIARASSHAEPEEALRLLGGLDPERLAPADRVQLHWELGRRLRHVGRTAEAAAQHLAAREHLLAQRGTVGAELAERYELEALSTSLSRHEVHAVIDALNARLRRPFLSVHNELRARGLLAFALGVAGDSRGALATREDNLPLHDLGSELAASRPFTLCYLAYDAARVGDVAAFERYAARLCQETAPGDGKQWRYNAMALIRGLVALGRDDDALAWAEDRARYAGARSPASLCLLLTEEATAIEAHPEVGTVRGLVRALGRSGRLEDARRLSDRIPREGDGLIGWLRGLVHLELATQLFAAGWAGEAADQAAAARRQMARAEPAASVFHRPLIDRPLDELAAGVDGVWY